MFVICFDCKDGASWKAEKDLDSREKLEAAYKQHVIVHGPTGLKRCFDVISDSLTETKRLHEQFSYTFDADPEKKLNDALKAAHTTMFEAFFLTIFDGCLGRNDQRE